jgi:hypothetical protein
MIETTPRGIRRPLPAAIAPFFAYVVFSLAFSASPLSAQAAADLLGDEVSRGDTYAAAFDLSNVELGKKARLTLKLPNSLVPEKGSRDGRYRCKLQNPAGATEFLYLELKLITVPSELSDAEGQEAWEEILAESSKDRDILGRRRESYGGVDCLCLQSVVPAASSSSLRYEIDFFYNQAFVSLRFLYGCPSSWKARDNAAGMANTLAILADDLLRSASFEKLQ